MRYLAEGAEAEVVPGGQLRASALLALDELMVSAWAAVGPGDCESYLLRTHGNSWGLWTEGDEFRFDSTTGLLENLSVHLPETNLADPGVIAPWLGLTPVVGLLRREDKRPFVADSAEKRWCAEDGSVLMGLYGSAAAPPTADQCCRRRSAITTAGGTARPARGDRRNRGGQPASRSSRVAPSSLRSAWERSQASAP